jgi:hypothetical protein
VSRFQEDDLIRHRTGVGVYEVTKGPVDGNYTILADKCTVAATFACNYVDENFILVERRIQDEVVTEDMTHALKLQQEFMSGVVVDLETGSVPNYLFSMPRGAGKRSVMEKVAKFARAYGTDLDASSKKGRWVKAAPPFKIDRNAAVPEDVAVTLEGIPRGYYLKAFRPAGPADLIIKTDGVICKEEPTYFKSKVPLIRPIVAEIPPAMPHVPGVPAGYELVRVGSPHPGDLAIGYEGEVEECFIHIVNKNRPIVRKKINLAPCTGVLPGIPLGYKVVRFGDVSPEEFYFDTVGNLKQGPSKHRLVVEKRSAPSILNAAIDRIEGEMGALSEAAFKRGAFDDSLTRNDTADAVAYAVDHISTVQVEKEYKLNGARLNLWTAEPVSPVFNSTMWPTGRTRKVKVI